MDVTCGVYSRAATIRSAAFIRGNTVYVIGSEKTCHVDKKMIIVEHLLIYRMHFILFYLNVQK